MSDKPNLKRMPRSSQPALVKKLLARQGGCCPLCTRDFKEIGTTPCVDHDHTTGAIRAALCRNCNGMEGKVLHYARRAQQDIGFRQWLKNLLEYYDLHDEVQVPYMHWTHETDDQKRLKRNATARKKTAAKRLATTNIKKRSTR